MKFYSSDNCHAMAPQKVIFPKVKKILLRKRFYKVKMIFLWSIEFLILCSTVLPTFTPNCERVLTKKLQIQNLLLKETTLDVWKLFLWYILPGIFLALFLEFAMFVKLAILDFQNGRRSSVKGNDPIFWWL